jgi:hypothetical protein
MYLAYSFRTASQRACCIPTHDERWPGKSLTYALNAASSRTTSSLDESRSIVSCACCTVWNFERDARVRGAGVVGARNVGATWMSWRPRFVVTGVSLESKAELSLSVIICRFVRFRPGRIGVSSAEDSAAVLRLGLLVPGVGVVIDVAVESDELDGRWPRALARVDVLFLLPGDFHLFTLASASKVEFSIKLL